MNAEKYTKKTIETINTAQAMAQAKWAARVVWPRRELSSSM